MSNYNESVPLSSDIITQSEVNEELRCSVCHEDFRLSEEVSRLVCNHVFHQSCITPWLERSDTCPVCRRLLRETPARDTDSDDDLYADDEDEEAVEEDTEEEVVVLDSAVSDGMITVSVEYRSLVDQQPRTNFRSTSITSISSDVSVTLSDLDYGSGTFPDLFDTGVTNSVSSLSSDLEPDDFTTSFEASFGDPDMTTDCDNSHVCFLELDDSSDSSDFMDMDSFESSDLDLPTVSNCFDVTFESSMDIDNDMS